MQSSAFKTKRNRSHFVFIIKSIKPLILLKLS